MIVRIAVPFATGSMWYGWPVFLVGMFVLAVAVGVVESTMARVRLTHIPTLLVTACLLSAFGILTLVR